MAKPPKTGRPKKPHREVNFKLAKTAFGKLRTIAQRRKTTLTGAAEAAINECQP